MKRTNTNTPEYGKQYRLTAAAGTPCVANGNTWAESEVPPVSTEEAEEIQRFHDSLLFEPSADRTENDEQRRELGKEGK